MRPIVLLLAFTGLALASGRLLPLHSGSKQLLLSSQVSHPSHSWSAALDGFARHMRSPCLKHHIQQAIAAAGAKSSITSASSPDTCHTAHAVSGALSPVTSRRLAGTQDNMVSSSGNINDALRQSSTALSRSRIASAVESGADRETTTAASQNLPNVPLKRALRQDGAALTDAFRAIQRQERAAASTAMIRRAVNGEMDITQASQVSAMPERGTLISSVAAERAASNNAAQERAGP